MGPSMVLSLRRLRPAGADMEHEAFAKAKPVKKKVRPQLLCLYLPKLQACQTVPSWSKFALILGGQVRQQVFLV